MRLFCGHCGKEQEWDVDGSRARPLPDTSAPDGMKRTKDGGRVLYDARGSTCAHCCNMVMCNPLSAVCIYCDSQLAGFRPTFWKCSNVDGSARRRMMGGATSAPAGAGAGSAPRRGASRGGAEAHAAPSEASAGARQGSPRSSSDSPTASVPNPLEETRPAGCEYARTCALCADYDLRYSGKPRCRCLRFHGAIAGQVTGNKAGNLGWVMVH
ncbi:hypothetical protein GPECTOR_3g139 [Gonium pectorale]|uniref:Uncharacterized protein n=1 Tax=Gonium pectorale TaxID=33097 RepID=A0A150GZ25_GONPE|nr:hypothetical protein GPECTOR_3g139 [Gonium pectorale]|eukprot:KXZ54972.1 hypothetical protein GPECTOR_3g139 [Gonium pectorale]